MYINHHFLFYLFHRIFLREKLSVNIIQNNATCDINNPAFSRYLPICRSFSVFQYLIASKKKKRKKGESIFSARISRLIKLKTQSGRVNCTCTPDM